MSGWPYPGDSPVARARRVAHAYRAALLDVDAGRCAEVDAMMGRMGQPWVVPRVVHYEPDDMLSAADAADVAMVDPDAVRHWLARGRLTGRKHAGRWQVRAGDVLALVASLRRRSRMPTKCGHGNDVGECERWVADPDGCDPDRRGRRRRA